MFIKQSSRGLVQVRQRSLHKNVRVEVDAPEKESSPDEKRNSRGHGAAGPRRGAGNREMSEGVSHRLRFVLNSAAGRASYALDLAASSTKSKKRRRWRCERVAFVADATTARAPV